MTIKALTVKARILLHLFDYNRFADEYEAPIEVTQSRIARAVGIRVKHVTQYVKPLVAEGAVAERTSHVRRQPRRLKVYFLTAAGRQQAASLRSSLLGESVPFRTRSGETAELPLSRVYHEDRRGSSVLNLIDELNSAGHIAEVTEAKEPELVDFTQEASVVERFYGREQELEWVLHSLEQVPTVVVTGIAGIGKTALGSRIRDEFRGKRSLFWRRVRPWDTAVDLALRLGGFLKALGRLRLHSYLSSSGSRELSQIEELITAELVGVNTLLVFDDVHTASEDAQTFLSMLHGALKHLQHTSCLLLSRSIPEFYSRRDVEMEGAVAELSLDALDSESGRALLSEAGISGASAEVLLKSSGGNPLFLKILAKAGAAQDVERRWNTLETYIAQEIEPDLSREERNCLQLASFYEVPVPTQGLLLEESGGTRTLLTLQKKGLLDRLEAGGWMAHEMPRSYFQGGLPLERRNALIDKVVPWLLEEAEGSVEAGNPYDAVAYVENAAMHEVKPARRSLILERLGELRVLIGDWPGAIEAYRTLLTDAEEPRVKARLHRDIASMLWEMRLLKEAEEEIERGLQLLPPESSPEAAWLLTTKGWVHWSAGDVDRYFRALERLETWTPSLPEDFALRGVLAWMRGTSHLMDPSRRDLALARAHFEASIEAFEAGGIQGRLWYPHTLYAQAAFEMGEAQEALGHLNQALELSDAEGNLFAQGQTLFTKARVLSECLGDFEAAEALYNEAYGIARMISPYRLVWFHRHFADLYRRQGRVEEAREALEHFLTTGGETIARESRIESLALMVRLSSELGDADSARLNMKEAEDLHAEVPSDTTSYYLDWAKGALHAFQGETEYVEACFQRALSRETPAPRGNLLQEHLATEGLRGELLLEYGRSLSLAKDKVRARRILLQAFAELEEYHREPLERIAQQALESLD